MQMRFSAESSSSCAARHIFLKDFELRFKGGLKVQSDYLTTHTADGLAKLRNFKMV